MMKPILLAGCMVALCLGCSPSKPIRENGAPETARTVASMGTTSAPSASPPPVSAEPPGAPVVVDGKPFADFCNEALSKKSADEVTLHHMEAVLGVRGCEELEKHLSELSSFSSFGPRSSEYDRISKELKREVTSLKALAYATRLRVLELPYGTPVSDLKPLANLKELTTLSINASKVSDVSPLRGLNKLEELGIRTTQVRDITPLFGLRIRDLDIRNLTLPADQVQRYRAQNPQATVWEGRNR